MSLDAVLRDRLAPRLRRLYGDRAEECLEKILDRARKAAAHVPPPRDTLWDQRDVVLITYADQVRAADRCPLAALEQFLRETGLDRVINTVHLLPCFPYSSDDGFSVIDYRRIDPAVGDWADVRALGQKHSLMLDLVLNHVSRQSPWFEGYAAGREPYVRYFIEVDPAADLSAVTRPRSLPLLTPVETSRGTRYLWTTFSDDQIDLNYAEPDVLVEMIDVLLLYLEQGARLIRLDAIAYLWKQPGTPCIHLPQTHEVVKLLRDVVDAVAPDTILLTETNVPRAENVSYFGNGDEARMVYQFSLAPLLLEALLSGDAGLLVRWLAELEPTPPGTTTLNFTASHDGIGVRPLEGLMPPERFERLIESVIRRGGQVSTKRNPDGSESPYELNVTYFSALAEPDRADGLAVQVRRFLASQALMLSLRGVPAVYFHSLVATPNDVVGAERTGRARSINRRKFDAAELRAALGCLGSPPAEVLAAYRRMLAIRIAQPAFHPEADQQVIALDKGVGSLCLAGTGADCSSHENKDSRPLYSSLVAFLRTSLDARQRILVLANLGPERQTIDLRSTTGLTAKANLLSAGPGSTPRYCGAAVPAAWAGETPAPQLIPGQVLSPLSEAAGSETVALAGYEVAWLEV